MRKKKTVNKTSDPSFFIPNFTGDDLTGHNPALLDALAIAEKSFYVPSYGTSTLTLQNPALIAAVEQVKHQFYMPKVPTK